VTPKKKPKQTNKTRDLMEEGWGNMQISGRRIFPIEVAQALRWEGGWCVPGISKRPGWMNCKEQRIE
jgi:hypothetical protein